MGIVRWLFRHSTEWLAVTVMVGLMYATYAIVAVILDRHPSPILHGAALALFLLSGALAGMGVCSRWLDDRMAQRLQWIDQAAEQRAVELDRAATERSRTLMRRMADLETWFGSMRTAAYPTLRAVGGDETPSIPAQANKERKERGMATVTPIDRIDERDIDVKDAELRGYMFGLKDRYDGEPPSGDIKEPA